MSSLGEADPLERPTEASVTVGWHAVALTGYTIIALIFIDHGESLTRKIAGQGNDPFAFVWFLAWWPWAITHHLNPLFTNLVWQPEGVSLAWVASVPLLSILSWPITLVSPVLSFNILILCGPVLAAWATYFLCLTITRRPPVAIIGGFLFGFSSYEMAQDTAVLNLSFTACLPLLLLLVLLRLNDSINRAQTVFWAALVLIGQFLICVEIFAMIFVFGGLVWILAVAYLPAQRAALRRLFVDGLWTAPLVVLALSPFLVSMAQHSGSFRLPALWAYYYTIDLINIVIPSGDNLLGILLYGSTGFSGDIQEQDGYIGLPLLLIVVFYGLEKFEKNKAKFLSLTFMFLVLASLGPRLSIAGQLYRMPLPWTVFVHLPLLASALPARFAVFISLVTAIIAASWMAAAVTKKRRLARLAFGLFACIFLFPKFSPWMPLPDSRFFHPGNVEAVLGKNARVLVLPFAIKGPSSFWQEQTYFSFRQTGGYLGFPPHQMLNYPAVGALFADAADPHLVEDIESFCRATLTQFIVVGPGTDPQLRAVIAQLNWPARNSDDVIIYTAPTTAIPHE